MPYPGEHAARQVSPDQFDRFARHNDEFGRGIDVIYGIRGRGQGATAEVQSIRFRADRWTESQARRWLADHDLATTQLEPAMPRDERHNPAHITRGAVEYEKAHWGEKPDRVYEIHSPYLRPSQVVVEMGKLRGFYVECGNGKGGKIKLELGFADPSSLAYEQNTSTRLWPVLSAKDRKDVYAMAAAGKFGPTHDAVMTYGEAAHETGGRQASQGMSSTLKNAQVWVLGRCTHIIYETVKKGDGRSRYIHEFGEDGGVAPTLCMDGDGNLLLAGGSYIVEHRGIVN